MAKILGESGRYVTDEAARQKRRLLVLVIIVIAVLGFIEGVIVSSYLPPSWLTASSIGRFIILILAMFGIWAIDRWGKDKYKAIERRQENMLKGAVGEKQVGRELTRLPDGFCVINDLSTPNGNIDHVVVGPTGVFVLDAKAWRGVVTADGHGELLQNGKPTDKPYVRLFVGRMMGIRERVLMLAPGMEVHFNAVFVFTAARVEAKWGTTARLNCITDEQLYDYIAEKDFGKKLSAEEVGRIAQAFLGLAHMDKEFGRASKSAILAP